MIQDTIIALATPLGTSAIAMLRISGDKAITISEKLFKGKQLSTQASHTTHFGMWCNYDRILDEVIVGIYRAPNTYNGEDIVEISCHGSPYIVQQIIESVIQQGARLAEPGEFTKRAFLNGKLDLSQAEAVSDLIASENESQHRLAMSQMRGGYSGKIKELRQELIDFAALLELELDFSEEDVEFADRTKFLKLLDDILQEIHSLVNSFTKGNVIKKGIPVAIIGKPNAGKSTLLNALLQEEKAIVSSIEGTTRDVIEDTFTLNGILYRFIDTAGLRHTEDELEMQGINRSYEKLKQASIVLYVADISEDYKEIVSSFKILAFEPHQKVIIVLNKSDVIGNLCNAYDIEEAVATLTGTTTIEISAKDNRNIDKLLHMLESNTQNSTHASNLIVTNIRHIEALSKAKQSLEQVKEGLHNNVSTEFITIDIRTALQSLAGITGQITNEDVLSSVFSRFCIGK